MTSVALRFSLGACLMGLVLSLDADPAGAFSQAGGANAFATVTGHEYITAKSALLLLDEVKGELKDPKTKDLAAAVLEELKSDPKKIGVPTGPSNYDAKYHKIWAAIMGQRYVDTGGFSLIKTRSRECWDSVTQMQEEGQADHFLRRHLKDDEGQAGGRNAVQRSVARLRQTFLEAVDADENTVIDFEDGGATSTGFRAIKPYFLFGHALHLLEDSFSPEHGVRNKDKEYRTVMDIKSYMCTLHSGQHTHDKPLAANTGKHGDIIWKSSLLPKSLGNLRPEARAAVESMEDLWAIFVVSRLDKKDAPKLIDAFIDKWMQIDATATLEDTSEDAKQAQCEKSIGWPLVAYDNVRKCLEHIKPSAPIGTGPLNDYIDPYLLLPYHWKWTTKKDQSVAAVAQVATELAQREKARPATKDHLAKDDVDTVGEEDEPLTEVSTTLSKGEDVVEKLPDPSGPLKFDVEKAEEEEEQHMLGKTPQTMQPEATQTGGKQAGGKKTSGKKKKNK